MLVRVAAHRQVLRHGVATPRMFVPGECEGAASDPHRRHGDGPQPRRPIVLPCGGQRRSRNTWLQTPPSRYDEEGGEKVQRATQEPH